MRSQCPGAQHCIRAEWAFRDSFLPAETCWRLAVRVTTSIEYLVVVSVDRVKPDFTLREVSFGLACSGLSEIVVASQMI